MSRTRTAILAVGAVTVVGVALYLAWQYGLIPGLPPPPPPSPPPEGVCTPGETQEKTCDDGSVITEYICNESGQWEASGEQCPAVAAVGWLRVAQEEGSVIRPMRVIVLDIESNPVYDSGDEWGVSWVQFPVGNYIVYCINPDTGDVYPGLSNMVIEIREGYDTVVTVNVDAGYYSVTYEWHIVT